MSYTRAIRPLINGAALAAFATAPLLAEPHNGLADYQKMLAAITPAGTTFSDKQITYSSPLAFGAMGNMPAWNANREVDALVRQLSLPVPAAQRGENKPAWETFALAQWNTGDFNNNPEWPIYDPQSYGGMIGTHTWLDDERLAGATISYNRNRADIHDDGGRIDNDNIRLRLYAALVPEQQPWQIYFGAHAGYNSYDSSRNNPITGETATADPDGYDIGVFVGGHVRLNITEGWDLVPFFRFDYDWAHVGNFSEDTNRPTTDTQTSLSQNVKRFDAESMQTRLGTSLEYTTPIMEGATLRAGFSAAWVSEFGGNDIEIRSAYKFNPGVNSTTEANQMFGDAFEFSPSVSLVLDSGLTVQLSYLATVTINAQIMQNVTLGAGWRF